MAGASTGFGRLLLCVVLAGGLFAVPVLAGVTTTDSKRAHVVSGTTAREVVSNMMRRPLRGDHGGAFANIRPYYSLSIDSAKKGNVCRATDVDVKIRFVITLPEATHRARMSKSVRGAWDNFADFARRHENQHKQSYVGCAKAFVARALRERGPSCGAVESVIRRMFEQSKRDCEAKQLAFDKQQRSAVSRLRLFNMAGY